MCSTSTSIRSPGLRNTGGLRANPTPAGVPVAITSPGSSVMLFVMNSMISGHRSLRRQEITFGFGGRIRGVVPNSLLIASMRVPIRRSRRACAASVSLFNSVVRRTSPAVGA